MYRTNQNRRALLNSGHTVSCYKQTQVQSLSSNGSKQSFREDQPQIIDQNQSLLLSMPTEVLYMILGYVLSTSAYISARSPEYIDDRIEEYEKFYRENYGVIDGDDEKIISQKFNYSKQSPSASRAAGTCPSEDFPVFCADSDVEWESSEELQENACCFFPIICRHNIQKWNTHYPEILASCRLLNTIGRGLLPVHKTISVVYYYTDGFHGYEHYVRPNLSCHVAGECSIAAARAKYPALRSVETWSLSFYVDIDGDDLSHHFIEPEEAREFERIQEAISEDVSALQSLHNLTTLFIDLQDLDERSQSEGELRMDYYQFFCNPFRVLRANSVDVHIPAENLIEEIEADITSQSVPYDVLANKKQIESLVNDIIRESDYADWIGWEVTDFWAEGDDAVTISDGRLPKMSTLNLLEPVLRDLWEAWIYWRLPEIVDPILLTLHYLQNYLELASARVGRVDVSRPIPRWVARIHKKIEGWSAEIVKLVNSHEALRLWYRELYGEDQ